MLNPRTQNQEMKRDGLEAKNQASKDWEYCSDLSCHGSFPCARHPNRKKHVSRATRRQQAQEEHGKTQVSGGTRRAKTAPARPVPSPRGSQPQSAVAAPLEAKQAHGTYMEVPKPSEKRKAELQSAAISPLPDTAAQRKFELKESFDVSSPRDIPVKKNRPHTPFQDVVLLPHGDALLERGQEPTQGVTENPQSVLSTASLDATEHAQPPVSSELNLISSQDAEGTGQQGRENSTHEKVHEHAQMAAEKEPISVELDRISAQGGLAEGEVQQPKSELPAHAGPSGAKHLFPEAPIAEIIASIPDSIAFPTQQAHVLPDSDKETQSSVASAARQGGELEGQHQKSSPALALGQANPATSLESAGETASQNPQPSVSVEKEPPELKRLPAQLGPNESESSLVVEKEPPELERLPAQLGPNKSESSLLPVHDGPLPREPSLDGGIGEKLPSVPRHEEPDTKQGAVPAATLGRVDGEEQPASSELSKATQEVTEGHQQQTLPKTSVTEQSSALPTHDGLNALPEPLHPELQTESKTEGITGHQRQSALALPIPVDQKKPEYKWHPMPSELASPQPQLLSAFLAGEPTPQAAARPESPYEALAPRQPSADLSSKGEVGDLPSAEIEATKEQI